MKKMLAAMLTALMLMTFLPLASQPARAADDTGVFFSLYISVDTAPPTYVGEEILLWIDTVSGGSGNYEYSFDVYKDGELFSRDEWHASDSRRYEFTSPGKYKVMGRVLDTVSNESYYKYSDEITVQASVNRINKIEPLGATSLRITWNEVPGAFVYILERSTDMKNWEKIEQSSGTSFDNTYLSVGTRYFYRVKYVKRRVYNIPSSPVAAGVPMAKTRITSITSPSARRIRMTWAKAAGASGYQVAMATSANGVYRTARIVTGGTTAIFSGVKSGSALFFKVRPYRRIYTTTYWGQYSAYRSVRVK